MNGGMIVRPSWEYASENRYDHLILAAHVQDGLGDLLNLAKKCVPAGDVRGTVQGVYEELRNHGQWVIIWEDRVHWPGKQPLRLPEELLRYHQGTCIEYVLLLASAVRAANLNPLIIVTRRGNRAHAVLGYWLAGNFNLDPPVLIGDEFREYLDLEAEGPAFGVIDASWMASGSTGSALPADEAEAKARVWLPEDVARYCRGNGGSDDREIMAVIDIVPAKLQWQSIEHRFGYTLPIPPYFQPYATVNDVKDWYKSWWSKDPGARVLALIGPGGAGKSTIEAELIRAVWQVQSFPKPSWSFSWRFGDDPSATAFLSALRSSLTSLLGSASFQADDTLAIEELLLRLQKAEYGKGLVILDELEGLQISSGPGRGCFKPEASGLKALLQWCCEEERPVRVLVSSKLDLEDLSWLGNGGYQSLMVDGVDATTAEEILASYGLRVTADVVQDIIDRLGDAGDTVIPLLLTVLARLAIERTDGDVEEALELLGRPGRGVVGAHLDRVLSYYETELLSEDALRLMRLLSLFSHVSLDRDALKKVYRMLPNGRSSDIDTAVEELEDLRLIEKTDEGRYRAHKSLGHYFRTSKRFSDRDLWRRAIVRYLERTCPRRLKDNSTDDEARRLLELIGQLAALGKRRGANGVYLKRMSVRWASLRREGPYDLLTRLNMLSVGLRAIEAVLGGDKASDRIWDRLLPWEEARLLNDKGGFERELGALKESERSYSEALKIAEDARHWRALPPARGRLSLNKSFALRNPPRTLIQRGLLTEGYEAAARSLEYERKVRDREGQQIALCLMAQAKGLLGEVGEANKLYGTVLDRLREKDREHFYTKGYALRWASLLLRAGKRDEAESLIDESLKEAERKRFLKDDVIYLMADILQHSRDLEEIRDAAGRTRRREVEIWCQLEMARDALTKRDFTRGVSLVTTGLELCERYGYALYWIDLQVVRGRLALEQGDLDEAYASARLALYGRPLVDGNERLRNFR